MRARAWTNGLALAFMAACAPTPAAEIISPDSAAAEPVNATLAVCANPQALASLARFAAKNLASHGFEVLDANDLPPDTDLTRVTLVYFGRSDEQGVGECLSRQSKLAALKDEATRSFDEPINSPALEMLAKKGMLAGPTVPLLSIVPGERHDGRLLQLAVVCGDTYASCGLALPHIFGLSPDLCFQTADACRLD